MDAVRAIKRLADTADEMAEQARKAKSIDTEAYHLARGQAYRECLGLLIYERSCQANPAK